MSWLSGLSGASGMNNESQSLRSFEESVEGALLAVYNLKLHRAGVPLRSLAEMKAAEGRFFCLEMEETRAAIDGFLKAQAASERLLHKPTPITPSESPDPTA